MGLIRRKSSTATGCPLLLVLFAPGISLLSPAKGVVYCGAMSGYAYQDDDGMEEENEGGDIPQQLVDLAQASVPSSLKGIRACMRCGILKTVDQFINDGCENCPFLDMADDPERCNRCTTAFFEGQAAVIDPRESWAARWLRVDNYLPGVYAISVTGSFDRDTEEDLENRGIRWRCRPAPA